MPNTRKMFLFRVVFIVTVVAWCCRQSATGSNIATYSTNRPNIFELVFSKDVLVTPEIIKEYSGTVRPPKVPKSKEYITFRRSGNDYFVEMKSAANSTNGSLFGKFDGKYWKIQNNNLYLHETDADAVFIRALISDCNKVSGFNLPHEGSDNIQWTGTKFVGQSDVGKEFTGSVVSAESGLVQAVELQFAGTAWPHIYEYKYSGNHASVIFAPYPTAIIGYVSLPGKSKLPVIQINIESFIPTNGIVPEVLLNPRMMTSKFKPGRVVMRSNDVLYVQQNGRWASVGSAKRMETPSKLRARIFMVLSLLSGLVAIFFLVRAVRIQLAKQQQT
jgi:hypothetical protein